MNPPKNKKPKIMIMMMTLCTNAKQCEAETKVIYKIESGRLIVEPVPSLEEVFHEKPSVEITFEEFHKHRKELSTKAQI
jgi:hypothetical protein